MDPREDDKEVTKDCIQLGSVDPQRALTGMELPVVQKEKRTDNSWTLME